MFVWLILCCRYVAEVFGRSHFPEKMRGVREITPSGCGVFV